MSEVISDGFIMFLSRTLTFDWQFIVPHYHLLYVRLILNYLFVYSWQTEIVCACQARIWSPERLGRPCWHVSSDTVAIGFISFVVVVHYPFRCPSLLCNDRTTLVDHGTRWWNQVKQLSRTTCLVKNCNLSSTNASVVA